MQPLECSVSQETPDCVVAGLLGELDLYSAPQVRPELERLAAGRRVLVLDLADLGFMDSSGIAMLVLLWMQFRREEGPELVLYRPTERASNVLALTGCLRLMRVLRTEEELREVLRQPEGPARAGAN